LLNAIPFSVLHIDALVKWCLIYSDVVISDAIDQPNCSNLKFLSGVLSPQQINSYLIN
jgi:hypothetical protein